MISCYGVGTPDNRPVPQALPKPVLLLDKHYPALCNPSISVPMKSSPKSWDGITRGCRVSLKVEKHATKQHCVVSSIISHNYAHDTSIVSFDIDRTDRLDRLYLGKEVLRVLQFRATKGMAIF